MKNLYTLLLIFVIIGAYFARMYMFHAPVADWHSWRQADTSAVSRHFVNDGIDVLHPKFDDLSKGVSLIDNPKGYRFVEFPIYNILQAKVYTWFSFTLEESGRVVTIVSQLFSILLIYLIMSHFTNKRAGLLGAAFYAFVPYNVYYGRVILPDSSMVTAMLASLYFFSLWMEKINSIKFFTLSIICTALAFLLKPYMLFFLLPHLYLAYKKFGIKLFGNWRLIIFMVISIAPLIAWRLWMLQYPEGIPQSNWLFNGSNIRFKGAFFHWIFADRIGKLILGYFGLPLVIVGIIAKMKNEGLLYISLLVSSLIYLVVMATGNVQHDYYQILIIPALAILFGKGTDFILSEAGTIFNRFTSYMVILACIAFMLAFGWFYVRDFYNLQHVEVVISGTEIEKVLPKNAKVVAPYGGDTTFLYNLNRVGWPVFDRPLRDFVKQGATHMAFVNPTAGELEFTKYFDIAVQGPSFVVFDLHKPTQAGKELLLKKTE